MLQRRAIDRLTRQHCWNDKIREKSFEAALPKFQSRILGMQIYFFNLFFIALAQVNIKETLIYSVLSFPRKRE